MEMHCQFMFYLVYSSLSRLLMVDLGEYEVKLKAFMIPLTSAFEQLGQVLAGGGYNTEEVRKTVISLARDLIEVLEVNTEDKEDIEGAFIPSWIWTASRRARVW